jgi:hypothetical protein
VGISAAHTLNAGSHSQQASTNIKGEIMSKRRMSFLIIVVNPQKSEFVALLSAS